MAFFMAMVIKRMIKQEELKNATMVRMKMMKTTTMLSLA